MKKLKFFAMALCMATVLMSGSLTAQNLKKDTLMVGDAKMNPSLNIVENALNSKDHTTFMAAVTAAELTGVLEGEGPFTVFAPTNAAFEKLPVGTLENLLKPENKETLQGVLAYHMIGGNFKVADVLAAIKSGNGTATFKTVHGVALKARLDGEKIMLNDAVGNVATLIIADVIQSNGVIHVIDTVLLPGK